MRQDVSLHDRFDLEKSPVLLNGTQAMVRLMLIQAARDKAAAGAIDDGLVKMNREIRRRTRGS